MKYIAASDRALFRTKLSVVMTGLILVVLSGCSSGQDGAELSQLACYSGEQTTNGDILEISCDEIETTSFEVVGPDGIANASATLIVCSNQSATPLKQAAELVIARSADLEILGVSQPSAPEISILIGGAPADEELEGLCSKQPLRLEYLLVEHLPKDQIEVVLDAVISEYETPASVVLGVDGSTLQVVSDSNATLIEFQRAEVKLETKIEGDVMIELSAEMHDRLLRFIEPCREGDLRCPTGKIAMLIGDRLLLAPGISGNLEASFAMSTSTSDRGAYEILRLIDGADGLGEVRQTVRYRD